MAKGSGSKVNEEFSELYKNSVFAVWQMNNKPSLTRLYDLIEVDERGRKPEITTLAAWKVKYSWTDRDLAIVTEVQQRTDRELVQIRMRMMERHAKQAEDIGRIAFQYLKDVGFDSSASAVTAAFKAMEEEKKSTGMGIALAQVFSLSDEDLKKKVDGLLSRASDIDIENTVDAELEEVDAPSDQETTDE